MNLDGFSFLCYCYRKPEIFKIEIMARPKSEIFKLKIFQVNIRLTAEEQVFVENQANSYGISVVEYVRKRALNKQLPKHALSPINRELLIELSRIGNNVNQLAKRNNQNFLEKYVFNRDLRELKEILNQIKTELLG
ncbi:MobC family plasmid mobilization relaxosome protein [Flavobacterium okayamense]|uniref:Mobilisation protein (MobC) n=1 Tax=Flavobacterium okayamense TaxID=2830782 RepID=A0ABN6HV88_9FLAO|nr:MobC family plasmid mobilization relaxosome protein [Flavobacterium okayamense]BCY28365.1 hypothetical protein KK2020170_12330 [Flavobacterium okayamense]